MQFREAGKVIQIIKAPYDKERKRCVQRLVGSFRISDETLSDELISKLSADELREVEDYRAAKKADIEAAARLSSAKNMADDIRSKCQVVSLLDAAEAVRVWESIAALKDALRRAGHKRPKADPIAVATPAVPQNAANGVVDLS